MTVTGNVSGAECGIYLTGGTVAVTGDVSGGTFRGVHIADGSVGSVTVTGNVTEGGVYAGGMMSSITVTGNVTTAIDLANAASAYGTVQVGGNATSSGTGGNGVWSAGSVTVEGNVSAENIGVYADCGGTTTIEGTITAAHYICVGTTEKAKYEYASFGGGYYRFTDDVSTVRVTIDRCIVPGCATPAADGGFTDYTEIGGVMYYHVSNAKQLAHVAEHRTLHYLQTADIDLSADYGSGWTPIGYTYETPFTGVYDGGGHTVSGLNVGQVKFSANGSGGLFGALVGGAGYMGGIAGRSAGNCEISDAYWLSACGADNQVGSDSATAAADGMAESAMRGGELPGLLKAALGTLADTGLYTWQQTAGDYPTLSSTLWKAPQTGGSGGTTIVVTTGTNGNSTTNRTQITPTASSGTASAAVSSAVVGALLDKAASTDGTDREDRLELTPDGTDALAVSIRQSNLARIVSETDAGLSITSPFLSVTFDGRALQTISAAEKGGTVVVTARTVDPETLSGADREKVVGRPVYDFTVTNGDTQVTDFGGGRATVSIPYTLQAGERAESVVYYLADDGSLRTIRGHYDAAPARWSSGPRTSPGLSSATTRSPSATFRPARGTGTRRASSPPAASRPGRERAGSARIKG